MKTPVLNLFAIFLAVWIPVGCGTKQTASQRQAVSEEVRQRIENSDFTFKAVYAYPTGFKSIYLSPYYDVRVSPDTVQTYLPYYGRAYTAPMDPREGGIKFTSTDFDYRIDAKKRGNRQVTIRTKDTGREIVLHFDIWENGQARLSITDANRQSISFSGSIETNGK